MIVAITGGSGFIGQKLVNRHLELGDSVRILTRKSTRHVVDTQRDVNLIYGDLVDSSCDLSGLVKGVDVLYHCAGEVKNPALMHALHVDGTNRLITAAAGHVGHWVQLSSVGAYGAIANGIITEESPIAPIGPYEISKTMSDELVTQASEKGGFTCSILRPANVYGPTMSNQSLFQLISMIDRGLFFFIGRPGSTTNYIHVDNVINALLLCGRSRQDVARVYNLSDTCTLEHLVECVSGLLGRRPPRFRIPEGAARIITGLLSGFPGFPLSQSRINALTVRSSYSIGRIVRELNYAHQLSVDEGLKQMVEKWKKYGLSE